MAKSVVASNNVDQFELNITCFSTPNITYNLSDWDAENIELIKNATNLLFDMGRVLYELTISCQMNSLSVIACASTVNNHKGDMDAYIMSIDNILHEFSSSEVTHLLAKLTIASNILDKLVNELLINDNLGNTLKYCCCEYIYMLCNY